MVRQGVCDRGPPGLMRWPIGSRLGQQVRAMVASATTAMRANPGLRRKTRMA